MFFMSINKKKKKSNQKKKSEKRTFFLKASFIDKNDTKRLKGDFSDSCRSNLGSERPNIGLRSLIWGLEGDFGSERPDFGS